MFRQSIISRPGPSSLTFVVMLGLAFGYCSDSALAYGLNVRLSVASLSPAVVSIDGYLKQPSDRWSYRNSYGRVTGLGERITNFTATDAYGGPVAVHRVGLADFKSEKPVSHFHY